MFLVLASRYDTASKNFVAGWGKCANLLTCEDLSRKGWRYTPDGELSAAVIRDDVVDSDEIQGVLTRLPSVSEEELGALIPGDRSYAVAEITAFLVAWTSGLKCRVLNRPTPSCLMGPYWRPEKWVLTAAKLKIPAMPVHRSLPTLKDSLSEDRLSGSSSVTVVGNRCYGDAHHSLYEAARALADAAGVGLLCARFATPRPDSPFLGADYWADLTNPEVSDAIRGYLQERPGK